MALLWKGIGIALLTLLLGLTLGKGRQEFAPLLTAAACAMLCAGAVHYLEPVVDFLGQLEQLGQLRGDMLGILLKAMGIALVVQIAGMVCADAGNGGLAKQLELLGSAAILYLSLPVFSALLSLIQEILGGL